MSRKIRGQGTSYRNSSVYDDRYDDYDDGYEDYENSDRRIRQSKQQKAKALRRKKNRRSHRIGLILALIQFILSILLVGLLIYSNMLPLLYLVGTIALLVLLIFLVLISQSTRKLRFPGKIISVLLSIALAFGSYSLALTSGALYKITGKDTQVDKVSVVVLKNDPSSSLTEVRHYPFGISKTIDRNTTDKAVKQIKKLTGTSIAYTEYSDYPALAASLLNGETKAILLNEAQRFSIEEKYKDFSKDTKIITTFSFESKISSTSNVNVKKEPFAVYLSGNDQTGEIASTGRTDVNICAIVNPSTKQVLLLTTPRDAYVPLYDPEKEVPDGSMDKLTHSGNFGIDVSMKTLEKLYQTSLDYYVTLNFTGFQKIVDAIGGVDIDVEANFTSIDGYQYKKGVHHLNGIYALNYARERHAFQDGDLARNRHQAQVLTAILGKLMSPSILANYSSLMNSVPDAFRTSLSTKDISGLVKMQLADGASWNIVSFSVTGTGSKDVTYSIPSQPVDTVRLNEADVATAMSLIQSVRSGNTLTQEQVDQLKEKNQNNKALPNGSSILLTDYYGSGSRALTN